MVVISHKDTGSVIYRVDASSLVGVNLKFADLSHADLRGEDLKGADLEKANLTEATLTNADLTQVCLRYANLRRAKLSETVLFGADLRDADLRGANLNNADMRGAQLQGADIVNASLCDVSITGADFSDVKTYLAKRITFSEAPKTPITLPQDIFQSVCKKCGQESFGRYFGFHYGVRADEDAYYSKYRVLGYREVFLCKSCIRRRHLYPYLYVSPITLLIPLAIILFPNNPTLSAAGLMIIGFLGLIYLLFGLTLVLAFYVFHHRDEIEKFAASLCQAELPPEVKEEYKKDRYRAIFTSGFYTRLE